MKINDEKLLVEDHTSEMDLQEVKNNKIYAVLAYVWLLFFIPLIGCPKSKYGRFHANQGLMLLLTTVAGGVIIQILNLLFGLLHLSIIVHILSITWGILMFVLFLYGIVHTIFGKSKTLPFVGRLKIFK